MPAVGFSSGATSLVSPTEMPLMMTTPPRPSIGCQRNGGGSARGRGVWRSRARLAAEGRALMKGAAPKLQAMLRVFKGTDGEEGRCCGGAGGGGEKM